MQYARLKGRTAVSLRPQYFTFRFIGPIFSVGLASALATALGNASNMVMVHLASGYGDIPVAAYGIVKRIDQFPLNVSMGLCQGFMPLVGYNYAARNYGRMRAVSYFSWKAALIFSACCVACFAAFAPQILHLFIPEAETSALGAPFLRIACLAVPLTAVNFLISYTLQAMGKGVQSAVLTACRQGPAEHPPAHPHGPDGGAVRHDLDPAGGGGHHAAGVPGHVPLHLPAPVPGRTGRRGPVNEKVYTRELFETSPTVYLGIK